MGWWQVNADTLAGSRFVVSPLAETFASLKTLHAGAGVHPGEQAWLAAHLPAYRKELARDPVTASLVRAGLGKEWIADFLTPTPHEDETLADEIARVRATDPAAARAHLALSVRGPVPADLCRDDLPGRAADLLTYVWEETVRPYWERRRRVLEADVLARTARLGQGGWAAVLDAMRPGMRWLGDNRLQVNLHEYPPREISGARLVFVPVTPQRTGWVAWEEGERYAVVYPCSGVLADGNGMDTTPTPAALRRLLGDSRARILVLLDSPMSTTQLCAVTGQALGSVGRQLRVLLDAGLVRRGRAGRSVLYVRTAEGEVLVRAAPHPRGGENPSGDSIRL
ncbi:ArsR/SmtB family transcription factor [Streptomyces griseiscabiei]|uniref:Winged helix-turn-helix domain-containing protein n=1 Tax=Streptomyces griseiscabiei TaxID=2993540 RepID=A0ABU4LIL1_9ACTN|nr:winged helix-turn-helix domain-containing protein [Streptomyces griseiscabiei]MBZ3908181.1 winged helix-turn-helix transcriptional regulator [Streptomyces griseiscabiei]MDX2915301.1 winged helix-turn-helix domain-containing protein [Streptomyces griseiscabiei]